MAITLNHTIVPAHDKEASAKFFAHIFGLSYQGSMSHFAPVRINETLTLDFDNWDKFEMHHYAFHVGDAEFDASSVESKRPASRMGAVRSPKRICRSTSGVAGAASISRIRTATYWSFLPEPDVSKTQLAVCEGSAGYLPKIETTSGVISLSDGDGPPNFAMIDRIFSPEPLACARMNGMWPSCSHALPCHE